MPNIVIRKCKSELKILSQSETGRGAGCKAGFNNMLTIILFHFFKVKPLEFIFPDSAFSL